MENVEEKYRLLAAEFGDTPRGRVWRERLGNSFREALDLLVFVLGRDLLIVPRELDGQHVEALVATLLPGRLLGTEPYRDAIVDLLEDFLFGIVEAETLTNAWELTRALDASRPAFAAALKNPNRSIPAGGPVRAPDRRAAPKIGRNDPCPCGSGRKYKVCCYRLA